MTAVEDPAAPDTAVEPTLAKEIGQAQGSEPCSSARSAPV